MLERVFVQFWTLPVTGRRRRVAREPEGCSWHPSRSSCARAFLGELFGWKVASEGAYPGYTFIDTGVESPPHTAISPRQATEDEGLFFVAAG
jgi:hypothetical protein